MNEFSPFFVGIYDKFTCRKPHIDTAHHRLHWTTTAFEYEIFTCETINENAAVAEKVVFVGI